MKKKSAVKQTESRENFIDKSIAFFSPGLAEKRLRARLSMEFLNSYTGASKKRRSLKQWRTFDNDADSDILPDLPTLRERCRDLSRNNPLASGAMKLKVTHVVGTGLRLQSKIDRTVLNLSDDQADLLEAKIQREWKLFFDSKDCDIARTLTGTEITRNAYRQAKENGDALAILPRRKVRGCAYDLKVQLIEADRLCNKDDVDDTDLLAGGIEKDSAGAPINYHFLKKHPGARYSFANNEWQVVKAFGTKTGLRNVIHLFNPTRPGQSRGVPDLAPVIELFKQLGRYSEAEIMAAVVSGNFTVFIEKEAGAAGNRQGFGYSNHGDESGQKLNDKDYKLGNGLIVELGSGEKIHDSNPGRPNPNFDNFVKSVLRQLGVGVEVPFEILMKHYISSYTAARAAWLDFWKYVLSERKLLTDNFLRPIFETFMWEAISMGRIHAPGFFLDPTIKAAYLGADFVGPSQGQINELVEVNAAGKRLELKLTTLEQETAALNGNDWEQNNVQQIKEKKKQIAGGLIADDDGKNPNNQGG
ncbi:MAG: phage portal protein [Desulfobacterales bacterium]|nr:phage portal protein [Desulfobacterales bacterium]